LKLSHHLPICMHLLTSRATCHVYLILLDLIIFNTTWRRVQVMKLLIMQFSPASCHIISLQSDILLSTLFSDKLSSSPNVTQQFSHTCWTTDKIIVLYILIFMILDDIREDERFWTEWY
jgi:hypothetical protein